MTTPKKAEGKFSDHNTARRSRASKVGGMARAKAANKPVEPKTLESAHRRIEALRLRMNGYTLKEIAEKLGCGIANVDMLIKRQVAYNAFYDQQDIDSLRKLDNEETSLLLEALAPGIDRGDPKSIAVANQIQQHRAKILGLNAPQKQELTGKNGSPIQVQSTDLSLLSEADLNTLHSVLSKAVPSA